VADLHARVGDGTTTAAVLLQALVRETDRYAGGGDLVRLRREIEHGLRVALDALWRQARPIETPDEIARVAASVVLEPGVATILGEALDAVGPDGVVLVEEGQGRETTCQYVDGACWNAGWASAYFADDGQATARVVEPRILVTDHAVGDARQLLPVLEACMAAGERRLVVIAPEVRDPAVALLLVNRQRGVLDGALAIRAPSIGRQRTRILEDLAILTGGRCVRAEAGERLEEVKAEDLGRARQVWATRSAFGVLGGRGERAAIRRRLAEAKAEAVAVRDDRYLYDKIQERIGKLAGTAAVVRVGAPTTAAREDLRLRVEAAVAAARLALAQGVVPGGGAALLACAQVLEEAASPDTRAVGLRVLARALAEPMRVIVGHAGHDAGAVVAEGRRRGPGWTFDVVRGAWVDAWSSGLVDAAAVVAAALEASVGGACASLSVEGLIRRAGPGV
jgi:chaperonin GroEL